MNLNPPYLYDASIYDSMTLMQGSTEGVTSGDEKDLLIYSRTFNMVLCSIIIQNILVSLQASKLLSKFKFLYFLSERNLKLKFIFSMQAYFFFDNNEQYLKNIH